jgi:tetratricopeptide (TPR) repeat protein
MIAAAAHRRGPARLMLIGTYRPVDLVLNQHPLKQVSHSLKAYRLSREILLPPLDDHEVSAILGPDATPALASWIRKQTEGNPLFALALIEHLRVVGQLTVPADHTDITVPETLRQLMELQIERLSPRDQLALDAAAVQGNTFSTSIIASALEVDAESIEDTCQDLARKNYILRPAPVEVLKDGSHSQRYEFLYPVIRGVFYQRLSAARRAKLHRRVAEAIESLRTGSPAEFAGELAGHFERSSSWGKSVEYLELSARKAMRRFEYKDALHTLQRALRVAANLADPERVRTEMQILDHLAILQLALHELTEVVPTLELLKQKGEDSGSRDVAARALLGLAVVKSGQDSRLCPAILEEVDRLILTIENPGAQYYFRTQLGVSRILMLGWDAALAGQLNEDVELIRRSGPPHLVASLCMDQAYVLWASARYDESLRNASQSLPVLRESGRLFRYLQGRELVAANYSFLGEWGKALDILDEGIEQARKNEAPMRLAMPLVFKAWVHLQAGDYRGVLEMCEQALEVLQGPYLEDRRRLAQQFALTARLRSGDRKPALTGLRELCAKTAENPVMLSWYWRMPMQLDLVEAWLQDGNLAAARTDCDRAIGLSQQTSDGNFQALALETSARIAVAQSDRVRAEQDIQAALDRMEGFDVPLAAWRVHRTAADLLSSDDHGQRSRQVIDRISRSIASRPELQKTFLGSTAT